MDYEHNKYMETDMKTERRCTWSDRNNNQCERTGIRDGLCLYHFNNLKYTEMDTNEKELWRIAQETYLATTTYFGRDWKAVADAVIAEHERRKAERIEADAKRASDMLAKAVRDFAEQVKPASYNGPPQSMTAQQSRLTAAMTEQVKPDPFAAEKAALDEARQSLAEMLHHSMDDGIPEEYWTDEWRAAVTRARAILSNAEPTETE